VALDLPMSNLLALDQSSHTTGYTVLRNGTIITVGHFECMGSDLGDRLVQLRKNIEALIEKYNIDEVVFEDIQLQDVNGNKETGIKTFKILAEAFGVVEELLTEKKIKHSAVLPIKWKAHFKIAGKGRAQEKKLA
jgi:Holliday junction resolvasome RuvABC endonuclease subunit